MKRKMILTVAALLLLLAIALPITQANAAAKMALGSCYLSPSGKSVTFGGSTESATSEDTIRVTATLWEQRNGTWYYISSVSKTKQIDKSHCVKDCDGFWWAQLQSHCNSLLSNRFCDKHIILQHILKMDPLIVIIQIL